MMNKDRIEAVAFDYYGTLVDAQQPFERIREWFDWFLEINGKYTRKLSDAFFMRFSRERARLTCSAAFMPGHEILGQSYTAACRRYRLPEDPAGFHLLLYDIFTRPQAFDGAQALITSLRTRLRVGLITNADNDILQQSILRQGFLFDFVVTSEDARCCKPSPAIFERALKQLDLSADRLLMVGDSLTEDIMAANRCGIPALFLNWRGQPAECPQVGDLAQLRKALNDCRSGIHSGTTGEDANA